MPINNLWIKKGKSKEIRTYLKLKEICIQYGEVFMMFLKQFQGEFIT
jgi:hypothetical protein